MISIIITAYNNPNYIHECLESIIKSASDYEYEILLGIDNCQKTLKSVYSKIKKYKNLNVFYFNNRVGTYIIRNSLFEKTNFDNILFFDSDDIMKDVMIKDILNNIKKYDCVKPMFSGFKDGDDITLPKFNEQKNTFGEGVFAIKKDIFKEMNGFEPWVCAADSEFNWRLRMNNKSFKYIERVSFYYRRHSQSLTSNNETGMRSSLRMKYHILTKNKKNNKMYQPLSEMVISEFTIIDNENINFEFNEDIDQLETNNQIICEETNLPIISLIFNKEPKKIEQKENIQKQLIVSNNPLFEIMKNKLPVIDKDHITEQRNNIEQIRQKTRKEINEQFNPPKPNRRLDLPNIGLR